MSSVTRSIVVFLSGIILFVGVPLIGWGVTDLQGFTAHPARLGYILVVVLLQAFVAFKFPHVGQNQGEGEKIVQRQRLVVFLLQILSLAVIIVAPFTDRRAALTLTDADLIRYLGLALFAFGFIGINWAEAALGKQFSIQVTVQEDHHLITSGIYRYLRHPRYLGIILFSLGIAFVFSSWLALFIILLLTAALLWRIRDEEAFLAQEFGAEWDVYVKKSWRLIPYVY